MGTQPVYPTYGSPMATQQMSGGGGGGGDMWSWLGPLLNFGGNLLGGFGSASSANADRNLQAQEFDKNYGLANNAQMIAVQNMLNRAPLADKAQYLALNNAAPSAFKPRDYTQGLSQLRGGAQGGPAAQLAANNAAAANYRQGAGGVDTSALNIIMSRLGGPSQQTSHDTTTVNYGGKQYTAQQWSEFLNQHPELAGQGL